MKSRSERTPDGKYDSGERATETRKARIKMAEDNWADRGKGLRCGRCMWFVTKEGPVGRCRRHAPSADAPGWAVVLNGDWCGDFKLGEKKTGSA